MAVLSLSYYLEKITSFCKQAIEEKTTSPQYKIEDIITDKSGEIKHIRLNIIPVGFICPLLTPVAIYTDKNLLRGMSPIEAIIISEIVLDQKKKSMPLYEYELLSKAHDHSNTISLRNVLTNEIYDITPSELELNTDILLKIKPNDLFTLGRCLGLDEGAQKLKQYLAFKQGHRCNTKS